MKVREARVSIVLSAQEAVKIQQAAEIIDEIISNAHVKDSVVSKNAIYEFLFKNDAFDLTIEADVERPKANPPVESSENVVVVPPSVSELILRSRGMRSRNTFAKEIGISATAVQAYENGRMNPSSYVLEKLKNVNLENGVKFEDIEEAVKRESSNKKRHQYTPRKVPMVDTEEARSWRRDVMVRLGRYGRRYNVGSKTLLCKTYTYMRDVYGFVAEQVKKELKTEDNVDAYMSTLVAISLDCEWKKVFNTMLEMMESTSWYSCKINKAEKAVM